MCETKCPPSKIVLAKSPERSIVQSIAVLEPTKASAPNGLPANRLPFPKHETKQQLRKRRPIAEVKAGIAALPKPKFDMVDTARLYRETVMELEYYQKRVNEGLDLEPAHRFCLFVFNSLLWKLFMLNASDDLLGIMDGQRVHQMQKDMLYQIREMWRTCKVVKKYDEGQVEALNRKIDMLAEQMGKAERPGNVIPLQLTEGGEPKT